MQVLIKSSRVGVSRFDEDVVFALDVFVVYAFPFAKGIFLKGHGDVLFRLSHGFGYYFADLFGGFLQLLFGGAADGFDDDVWHGLSYHEAAELSRRYCVTHISCSFVLCSVH